MVLTSIPCLSVAAEPSSGTGDITLHAVFPVSEDLASRGIAAKTALTFAVDDMNTLLLDSGSDKKVILEVSNITSEPSSALNMITKLHDSGVNMVLGEFSSAQIDEVKPYADKNGVLLLTSGSTATSLAIPGDNILRFNPDDSKEARAIGTLLTHENITTIIPLIRKDIWGTGIISEVKKEMGNKMVIDEGVTYEPGTNSYSEVLTKLDLKVGEYSAKEDPSSIGVLAATFEEITDIMEEASNLKYANLSKIRWFGTDGNTLTPSLSKSENAYSYAIERGYIGTTFAPERNYESSTVHTRMVKELGYDPEGFSYALYDMGKIAVLSGLIQNNEDSASLMKTVTAISDMYKGVTGEVELNEAGDRDETHYSFWTLKTDGSDDAEWKKVGSYAEYSANTATTYWE